MKKHFSLSALVLALVLGLGACNMPTSSEPDGLSLEDQASTIVAQTLEASITETPTETLAPEKTATKSPPTATITPTYAIPILNINENTHCRSGPGEDYEIVTIFEAGAKASIVGKHPSSNFWVVTNDQGNGTCWVWGEYATASGSYWIVPTMTPPPTVTPEPPGAPSLKNYNFSCAWNGSSNDLNIVIQWTDQTNNELGYIIYRDGVKIADLVPNVESYTDTTSVASGQSVNYAIEAYNNSGLSGQVTLSATCE